MTKLLSRGLAAVVGSIMLTFGAGAASAQSTSKISDLQRSVAATKAMFSNAVGSVFGAQLDPDQAEIARIAREADWLRSAGWPLYGLVDRFGTGGQPLNEEAHCIAVAVYHEARGESLEGQLAVAQVIMNRAASGKYPPGWCDTVKQPWQFSFVNPRTGRYPAVNESSASWRKAIGITRLAIAGAYPSVTEDVLWYHATYVSPSWGRRLSRADRIGTHIFYRA
jgi:N-acetylmuramoyl-L-alanine amidase